MVMLQTGPLQPYFIVALMAAIKLCTKDIDLPCAASCWVGAMHTMHNPQTPGSSLTHCIMSF